MKKKKLLFLLVSLSTFFSFCLIFPEKAFSLEVEYPTLQGGVRLVSDTSLSEYFTYLINFGIGLGFFLAFLSLIISGVIYFLAPANPSLLQMAKDRFSGAISGILIFALLFLILYTINPELVGLETQDLETISSSSSDEPRSPGVYLYQNSDCSGNPVIFTQTSMEDLGRYNNQIRSAKIINDENNAFVAILFEAPKYWGACQQVGYNRCIKLEPFASSISVLSFDFHASPSVTFYRKSFFNPNGGYISITAPPGKIGSYNFAKNILYKEGNLCTVKEKERDCIHWDKNGVCKERACPVLNYDNISSIATGGRYAVLLFFWNPSEKPPYDSFCQLYPLSSDINQEGPLQIKWDYIKNQAGKPINGMWLIPIKKY